MGWQESTVVSQRLEFCRLVADDIVSMSDACDRFGVSRTTGYLWLDRYAQEGVTGLANRSRRPRSSPRQTEEHIEAAVCAVRDEHPVWGGRKIRTVLEREGLTAVPSASTITKILRRHGYLDEVKLPAPPMRRFEAEAPNLLWQLDFASPVLSPFGKTVPLLIIDDHSRYLVGLHALADQTGRAVRDALTTTFRQYGRPWRLLGDNGGPWGASAEHAQITTLNAWLIRHGIDIIHGRPYHPQTQGKVERCVRTLGAEVLSRLTATTPADVQVQFDSWRHTYNHTRPHFALGQAVPASRYQFSPRTFPSVEPRIAYEPEAELVRVGGQGMARIDGKRYFISACVGFDEVRLHRDPDGIRVEVFYGPQRVRVVQLDHPDAS